MSGPVNEGAEMIALTRELCAFRTGIVADGNEKLFARLNRELPFKLLRWNSGDTHNGWTVPENWRVEKAEIKRDGRAVFDGLANALGVAIFSAGFQGSLTWEELKPHLVPPSTEMPDAYTYHCRWQYRPWENDWAFSVPQNIYKTLGPGHYEIDLRTSRTKGEMIVGQHEKRGRDGATIVFQSHNCHPHMANDGFAGTSVLMRLFQWLAPRDTHYTYRLVIAPEHLGTVFYLRDMPRAELDQIVCGVFEEMPGTAGPIKVASTFLGDQPIDRAFRNALAGNRVPHVLVPWRRGAGNDEAVWEAPGYEVPFVEVTRSEDLMLPFREFHTSEDTPDLMQAEQMEEMFETLKRVIDIVESNCRMERRFDGIVCLSHPDYDLYNERLDLAVEKTLPQDSEKWGYLQDCLLRYFDGSMTILDIAERHELPFARVNDYVRRFAAKGLVDLIFDPITRAPAKRVMKSSP